MHQTTSSQCRLVQTQTATQILIEIFCRSRQICCGYKYIGKEGQYQYTVTVLMSVNFDQNNPKTSSKIKMFVGGTIKMVTL